MDSNDRGCCHLNIDSQENMNRIKDTDIIDIQKLFLLQINQYVCCPDKLLRCSLKFQFGINNCSAKTQIFWYSYFN